MNRIQRQFTRKNDGSVISGDFFVILRVEMRLSKMEMELSILEAQPVRVEMRLVKMDVQLSFLETELVTMEMAFEPSFLPRPLRPAAANSCTDLLKRDRRPSVSSDSW
jgi:hypothetical protein